MSRQKELESKISKKLVGKTVKEVRYLTDEEMEHLMWHEKSLVIVFDDGSFVFPSKDDEGNGAGSLFTSFNDLPTIPTLR